MTTNLNTSPIPIKDFTVDLGVTIDSSLKFHQLIFNIVQKAGGAVQNLLAATLNREASFLLSLFISFLGSLLEYSTSLWNLGYTRDLRQFEFVQRCWSKIVQSMENLDYLQRLRALDSYSVHGQLQHLDTVKYWQIFHDQYAIDPGDILLATIGHH